MPSSTHMDDLAARARAVLPAGGFGNFDADVFIREGHGSRVIDENGREFIVPDQFWPDDSWPWPSRGE